MASDSPQTVGFFAVPNFAMMAFTSAVEPLRAANLLSGRRLYDWRVITRDGGPALSSNHIQLLADQSIETAGRLANVVVCSGLDAHLYGDKAVFAWLRRMARAGARVGALSDGSYILARAGLMYANGYGVPEDDAAACPSSDDLRQGGA